ncbi:fimbria/pilus outer membrane usher protein [Vibrio gallaecicus]|uniref:Fimbria/pilus outer membrane usher protein n=1 Tax=Vibrio gallaecicus TaxID=552386 RepID=A0ABV4NBP7_9VIBR
MKCETLRSLVLCLLVFLYSANSVLAKTGTLNPTGRDIELISLLKVSDSVLGEAEVVITADDKILLPKESTLILLEGLVTDEALTALRNSTAEASFSQEHFSLAGLDLTFDFSTLECIVTVPPQFLKTQQLSASSLMQMDDNHLSPAWISGYVNLSLSGNQSETVDDASTSMTSFTHRIDSALNIGSANFEYEATYENVEGEPSIYARRGTRMNVDFPSQGTRLVVGDMFNAGKNLQDSADILGIGLTRDFTLIPTRNVRPKATQTFTLQRTSNVDVLVDGIVVQRLTLNAGSYNLSDIPLAEGTNDVELVITDSSGQEERIQFSVATGNDLLDSGEFEYSLMVGVPSESVGSEIEYQSSEYLAHGYLDYGITPWLTLGINAQGREDLYQYGLSSLVATGIGVTEFIVSQSSHPTLGSGYAYRVAYDADLINDKSRNPQLSIIYDHQSENFSGVGDYDNSSTPLNTIEHYVSMFSSIDVTSRLRVALSGSYSSGSKSDDNYWTLSPSLSGPLFGTPATWSSRFNYRDYKYDHGSDDEYSTTLTLSWPLSKQTRVVSRYQSDKDLGSVDVSYKDGIGSAGGVSAYATLTTEREIDSNVDAGVNYTGNRIRIIADHTTRYQDLNEDDRSHNTRLELSSAIAFAGTSFVVGREVGEAFAIVKKHKSLAENKVSIDPERNTEYARVYSEGNTNILVPDLVAYSSQLITYDVEDLPPGYDLGDGAFSVYPGYKQGYELEVGSDAVLTVIGSLFHAVNKEPIALIAGKAYYLGKESGNKVQVDKNHEPLEFFTNRKGKFAISGMKPGHYRLELNTKKKQTLEITLPENSDVLVRIGEMYVD